MVFISVQQTSLDVLSVPEKPCFFVFTNENISTVNKDSRMRRKHGIGTVRDCSLSLDNPVVFLVLCQVCVQFRAGKGRETAPLSRNFKTTFFVFFVANQTVFWRRQQEGSPSAQRSDSHQTLKKDCLTGKHPAASPFL